MLKSLTGMVVEVKQQHVRYKTNHKPGRRFQNSFKSRCHDERIPSIPIPCQVSNGRLAPADSGAIGSRLDAEMIEFRLQSGAFQSQPCGSAFRSAKPPMAIPQCAKNTFPLFVPKITGAAFAVLNVRLQFRQ